MGLEKLEIEIRKIASSVENLHTKIDNLDGKVNKNQIQYYKEQTERESKLYDKLEIIKDKVSETTTKSFLTSEKLGWLIAILLFVYVTFINPLLDLRPKNKNNNIDNKKISQNIKK